MRFDALAEEEAFAAACRAKPEETVLGHASITRSSGWFEKLELGLVEERSCLADLCTTCGC